MMEDGLNAIWLLVAIGAFRYWNGAGYSGTFRRRPDRSYGILALACALILLFPVISLTDDLHSDQAVTEDSSRTVMKARAAAKACLRLSSSSFPALFSSPAFSDTNHQVLAAVIVLPRHWVAHLELTRPSEGRSPPLRLPAA
jgi:hypothetical protein